MGLALACGRGSEPQHRTATSSSAASSNRPPRLEVAGAAGERGLAAASGSARDAELETVDDEPDKVDADGDGAASCEPVDASVKPIELLRFTFASAIEGKDPRDRLLEARPGRRVYSHLVLRNLSGRERCVTFELRVDGVRRTALSQRLGHSWSWRTWAYNTLRADDRGKLEAIVRDDQGRELVRRSIPIVVGE